MSSKGGLFLDPTILPRWQSLLRWLRERAPLSILFSGGVDSLLVARAAAEALPLSSVHLYCILSDLDPPAVAERARRAAEALNLPLREIPGQELEDPLLASNPPHRCYLCRRRRHEVLRQHPSWNPSSTLVDGTHADDQSEHRPGLRACEEDRVLHPLLETGWTKEMIRSALRSQGEADADLPSSPCLATRIPYGHPLNRLLLARIAQAEQAVLSLGVPLRRIRVYAPDAASLEVPPEAIPQVLEHRQVLVARLLSLGFSSVHLDLEGYFPGKMDRALGALQPPLLFRKETPFE